MTVTYHSNAIIEERLSKDKKIKIRIHLNILIELNQIIQTLYKFKDPGSPQFQQRWTAPLPDQLNIMIIDCHDNDDGDNHSFYDDDGDHD